MTLSMINLRILKTRYKSIFSEVSFLSNYPLSTLSHFSLKLDQEEHPTPAVPDIRTKGTVRLNYEVKTDEAFDAQNYLFFSLHNSPPKVPRRPSAQPPHGPQVEDIATK